MTELQELTKYMDQRPGKTRPDSELDTRLSAPSRDRAALSLACWLIEKADGPWDKKTRNRRRTWAKLLTDENELHRRIANRIQFEMAAKRRKEGIDKRGNINGAK